MRLLVTRPEPEGERTAALLRARGHEVRLVPLLQIEPVADAVFGAGPWAGVVFTSANAVRAAASHRRFGELAGLPAYAVGARTREAAVAAGLVSVAEAVAVMRTGVARGPFAEEQLAPFGDPAARSSIRGRRRRPGRGQS